MDYLMLCPLTDKTVKDYIDRWIAESGGRISLEELGNRFQKRFRFFSAVVLSQEQWQKGYQKLFVPYRFSAGMVFQGMVSQSVH